MWVGRLKRRRWRVLLKFYRHVPRLLRRVNVVSARLRLTVRCKTVRCKTESCKALGFARRLSRQRRFLADFFQQIVDDLVDDDPFGLAFKIQHHPVP